MFDTIVNLITPPMKGAVAVIRLSGEKTLEIVQSIFSREITKSHHVYYGYIKNNEEIVDEVMLSYFKAPRSFTGEDVIEISSHGSMLIANQIISMCLAKGARLSERGEFTSRAFYNGRIDLVQAEAVNELINAQTEEAKKLSLFSLKGETSKLLDPLKSKLADILSLIEVNIDYPEYEDIETMTNDKIINELDDVINVVTQLIKDGEKSRIISEGIKISIIGRPNVGKSSLLNALLKQEKAIVTNIPGTTRDIVEGQINLNGLIINLLDTAGIREADNEVEKIGIERSKKSIDESDLVILVLEANVLLEEDKELLYAIKDKKHIIVYNKLDLIKEKETEGIYISAKEQNIKELEEKIKELFSLDKLNELSPSLCSAREIGLLNKVKSNLIKAKLEAKEGLSLDLISISLKEAYDAIKDILGEEVHVDLSEEIFSRFCVGK
ncbi:MAG: tRNA uridine-5-carboxymethylaminomethyl(34) synthesis GTPase MnmE [Bacillales bacterium]|nr:tRNA uridine-5-carboxymethylaminomethyl(34) synthesis GTPase MnmE [Bacillales bacterium]